MRSILSDRRVALRPNQTPAHPAVASASDFTLQSLDPRRLLSAGTLDPTFGAGGKLTDSTLPAVQSVAVQADGKIVEAGTILGNFSVARFNADGTPDTTFGYLGRLITDIGGTDKPTAIGIQSDGKIVIVGTTVTGTGAGTGTDVATVRYNPDGQLDNSFGAGGIVTTHFQRANTLPADVDQGLKLVIRPDGKIEVVGLSHDGAPLGGPAFVAARFNLNGTLDTTFATGGKAIDDAAPALNLTLNAIAQQPDGKIVMVGTNQGGVTGVSFIRRLNADGSLDSTSFTVPNIDQFSFGTGVAIQADGKIVVSANGAGGGATDSILFRDNPDGSADVSFGVNGVVDQRVTTPLGSAVLNQGLFIQADGKIVVGGQYITGGDFILAGAGDFVAARYLPSGAFDMAYGTAGTASPTTVGGNSFPDGGTVSAIAQGPGGSAILVGGKSQLDIARFTGDSAVVPPGGESPYTGTPAPIPGRIEAENFDNGGEGIAYHTSNPQNYSSFLYRTSGITVEPSADIGLGYNVGWLHAGDYLKYSVNTPAAGNYDFSARVADAGAGAVFHVEVDGVNVTGNLAIPDTGGYQAYQTVTKTGIPLTAGAHVVKLVLDANNPSGFAGNFNWIQFDPSAAASTGSISGTVYSTTGSSPTPPAPSAGQQVYLDIPGIGHFVPGDPTSTSDAAGHYSFSGLAPHAYLVRINPSEAAVLVQPSDAVFAGQYYIVLGPGANVSGKDFILGIG